MPHLSPKLALMLALCVTLAATAASATTTLSHITGTYSCDIFGCSVTFNNYVCNNDSVNGASIVVGSYFGYSGNISTCNGRYDSQDSWYLGPGACAWIPTYGPGYLGSKISASACVTVTSNPDIYCRYPGSSLTKTVCK